MGTHRLTARKAHFNPRSPHGERRAERASIRARYCDFNPRSPHGERPCKFPAANCYGYFNPRSPHGERRCAGRIGRAEQQDFNPRSPHGERRARRTTCSAVRHISIHAPRTGSDVRDAIAPLPTQRDFNPRSPHGERLRKVTILSIRIIGFAQKVYHKTVLLRISLAENAVILPEKPRNPVRTSLQKAGGLRFARAIRAARPYSISSPSGA